MQLRNRARVATSGLAFLASACAHGRVVPGTDARTIPGAPTAAVAEKDGIRVAANGDDWNAKPVDLAERLTPVKVRIVNHSGKPVRILYERFALTGAKGRRYRPLPLVPIDRSSGESVGTLRPIFASESFFVGPLLHSVYPTLSSWPSPLPRDRPLYRRQYQRWADGLPTREMQRMGLPEGVLGDGGQISGFLYFENATEREANFVFTADLASGEDGEPVTSVEIPFRVE